MKKYIDTYKSLALVSQVGITVTVYLGIGFFIGSFIDKIFSTGVLFSVLLMLVFGFLGMYEICRVILASFKKSPKDNKSNRASSDNKNGGA